jgi:hypothetical protein
MNWPRIEIRTPRFEAGDYSLIVQKVGTGGQLLGMPRDLMQNVCHV